MQFSSVSHRLVYLLFVHLSPSLLFFCVTGASTVTAGWKRKGGLKKDEQKIHRQGDEKRY